MTITSDAVTTAACHMYDAECALHAAHQTHDDTWITAAADKLHTAITEHLAACIAEAISTAPVSAGTTVLP